MVGYRTRVIAAEVLELGTLLGVAFMLRALISAERMRERLRPPRLPRPAKG